MPGLSKLSIVHLGTLAELFTNISAGFFGLAFAAPFPEIRLFVVLKNLVFGLLFYYLAVKLKEVVR